MTRANKTASGSGRPPRREQERGRAVPPDDESGERFLEPKKFAGYALHDPLGLEIGKVEQVFVNGDGGPEYVAVKLGSLWQRRRCLIPVEIVSIDESSRALVLR